MLRVPVCTKRGRDGVCRRWATLVTPMDNLEVAREAEVPSSKVGYLTLGAGIVAGVVGAIASARDPHSSGGGLLISLGAVAALFGAVQLFQPIQNERDLLP